MEFNFYSFWILSFSYQCTHQYVQKDMGNSFPNPPSRLRLQAVEEQSYPGEIDLENKWSNEDWRFT